MSKVRCAATRTCRLQLVLGVLLAVLAAWAPAAGATPVTAVSSWIPTTSPQYQYAVGSTMYYNSTPITTGSFQLQVSATEPGGIAHVDFPALGAGWSPGTATVDSTGPSPYAVTYSWAAGAMGPGPRTATAVAVNATTATAGFTITGDAAAPSGGSVGYVNGYSSMGSVQVGMNNGTDPLSGIGVRQLQRRTAPLVAGTCGSFGAWSDIGPANPALTWPDTSIGDATCAQYQLHVTDNVGNVATYTSASVVKHDTTPPTGTISATPVGPVSGLVTLSGTSADASSAVQSVHLSYSGPASGLIVLSCPSPSAWSCSWDTTGLPAGIYTITDSIYDVAGNQMIVTRTLEVGAGGGGGGDTTAPTGTISGSPAGPWAGTIAVAGTSFDAGSGVNHVNVTYTGPASGTICLSPATPTSWSCSWNTAALPDGTYTVTLLVTDNATNASSAITRSVLVDNSPPVASFASFTALTGASLQHAVGSTTYVNPTGAGSFRVDVAAADAGTGVSRVEFPMLGSGWTPGGTSTVGPSPYSFTYSWSVGAAAPSSVSASAIDNAGASATVGFTIIADATPPVGGSISFPPGPSSGAPTPVTFSNPTDAAAGLGATQLQRRAAPSASGSCGAFGPFSDIGAANPSSPYTDSTVSAGTCYDYRLIATDQVGNVRTITMTPSDSTPPTGSVAAWTAVANPQFQHAVGTTLYVNTAQPGSVRLAVAASDAGSGIADVVFPTLAPGWTGSGSDSTAPYENTWSWVSGAVAPGARTITLHDLAANFATTPFTITADTLPPTGGTLTIPNGASGASPTIAFTTPLDAGSGLRSLQLQRATSAFVGGACGDFGGGFSNLGPGNPASPFVDASLPDGTCARYRLVATDNVGNASTTASGSVVRLDTTPPVGASIVAPAGPTPDGNVIVTFTAGVDTGAGLTSWQVERATAPLVGADTCGPMGAFAAIGPARVASPFVDATVPRATCARYRLVVTDGAGNVTVTTASATTTVGAELPDAPPGVDGVPDPAVAAPRPPSGPARPTPGADTIILLGTSDRLDASGGDDVVHGNGGDDRLHGGLGNDELFGDPGVDRLFGDAGRDRLHGGAGNDSLDGGAGDDNLDGGDGDDHLVGGIGNDLLDGKAGNDSLVGGAGVDSLVGGAGNDSIDARDGAGGDTVRCGAGRDSVRADRGDRVARDCERVRRGA